MPDACGAIERSPAAIGAFGTRAVATDPDGNWIALHAQAAAG